MVEHLPDAGKIELAKAIQEVKKQASRLQKCLLCQLEGWGRYDAHATRAAWEEYMSAIEAAGEIGSDEVRSLGLFAGAEGREREPADADR